MAAAHTAHVLDDGQEAIVRFEGSISLPAGPALVRQDSATGEVILSPLAESTSNPWVTFFDAMDQVPRDDDWNEFMRIMEERPMNRLPVERTSFPDTK